MRNTKERAGWVLPIRPNWQRQVQLELDFLTDIFVSRNGKERREALRHTPRWSMNFQIAATKDRLKRLRADLNIRQTEPFFMPVEWRMARTISSVSPATLSLDFDDLPFWAETGVYIVIESPTTEQVAQIAVAAGDSITLVDPLEYAVPLGSKVRQARMVRFSGEVAFKPETSALWTASVRLEEVPGTSPESDIAISPPQFLSTDVFIHKPDWTSAPDVTIGREREVFDPGRGQTFIWSPVDFSVFEVQAAHFAFDAEEAEEVIAFFVRQKGQRGSFWMPTFTRDFPLAASTAPNATSFIIRGEEFRDGYLNDPVYRRVIAFWPTGGYQINTISGLTINGNGDTVVAFQNQWSQALHPDSRLHWLLLSRFAADKLTVDWDTTRVARFKLATRSLMTEEVV
jgi:hypothetical protein